MTRDVEVNRRSFLSLAGASVVTGASAAPSDENALGSVFAHGVASGDPTQHSVLLWTRVSSMGGETLGDVVVRWAVSADSTFSDILQSGDVTAKADADFTITVDVSGLDPDTTYFYQFTRGGHSSRLGRTKTLPTGSPEAFRIAVVSCANYASGFFNVYRDIADDGDVDLVVHLGDYIYEEGLGGFGTQHAREIDRVPEPNKELVTLEDYRTRYAQYRMDPDLQDLHALVPFICVWDDHEIVNGTWSGGSLDHVEEELGSWPERRRSAMRAYHEWLPLRLETPSEQDRIFRSFEAGDLFRLTMLDTRHFGREEILPRPDGLVSYVTNEVQRRFDSRSVLGDEQERWLETEIQEAASSQWHLIGQQFLVTPLDVPDLEPLVDLDGESLLPRASMEGFVSFSKLNPLFLNDSWDGYWQAKQRFLEMLDASPSAPVVLTGDIHMTVIADLPHDGTVVAHELVTPSVTSPGMDMIFPSKVEGGIDQGFANQNPDIRHLESGRHGWIRIDVTPENVQAEWRYVSEILSKEFTPEVGKRAVIERVVGQHREGQTMLAIDT